MEPEHLPGLPQPVPEHGWRKHWPGLDGLKVTPGAGRLFERRTIPSSPKAPAHDELVDECDVFVEEPAVRAVFCFSLSASASSWFLLS